MNLDLVTVVVNDYDEAVDFFVGVLGFDLVEDSPLVNDERSGRRWVVVRPINGATGLLLARGEGEAQRLVVGQQTGSRVGFFLRVDDFDEAFARMKSAGVTFLSPPRTEVYGQVAVFEDVCGNRWDLLGPRIE
jgi:catechol 2,3-dioxygenase-like lactoylglutathione lyase family enzyme